MEEGHEELHFFLGKLPSQEFASKIEDKIYDRSTESKKRKARRIMKCSDASAPWLLFYM